MLAGQLEKAQSATTVLQQKVQQLEAQLGAQQQQQQQLLQQQQQQRNNSHEVSQLRQTLSDKDHEIERLEDIVHRECLERTELLARVRSLEQA